MAAARAASATSTNSLKEIGLDVPLVVRLEGTNVELGKQILNESGLDLVSASDMKDGAQQILELTGTDAP